MTQTMVVTFNVPAMNVAIKIFMSLFAPRRTPGIVMGSADGLPHAVPFLKGTSWPASG